MLKSSSLCLYSSNLGTFWLKIEQFWPFDEISIFSNGGHLGYRTALTDTIITGFFMNLNFCLFWPIMQIRKKGDEIKKKIFSSETTEPISTKLCWNDPWVVLFQICVRHFRTPTKDDLTSISSSFWNITRKVLKLKKKLIEGPNRQTHFWKRTIQWLFHQNFVLIEHQLKKKKNTFRLIIQKL
jgi:hypothetical protein